MPCFDIEVVDDKLEAILRRLRFCPTCLYELITVYMPDRIVTKECKQHDVVFVVHPTVQGYEIKVDVL
jgi:hypothetical protein